MKYLKVCENCQFLVQQINFEGKTENVCMLTNSAVGLFWHCKKLKMKKEEGSN